MGLVVRIRTFRHMRPVKTQDQPVHPCSLIKVFTDHMIKAIHTVLNKVKFGFARTVEHWHIRLFSHDTTHMKSKQLKECYTCI